jgi:ribonuclease D
MSQLDLRPPVWVDGSQSLQELAVTLGRQYRIAVDTESNSLHAYRERVCLLQFSTEEADFLVDTLALHDLSPLVPIFESPNIEKVFHAVEYDIICLHRDFGIICHNIFDTMVAARTLGYPAVGLGSLLTEKFRVQVNKRFQKGDWGLRPLPAEMLEYARLDTHYLIPLRDQLAIELIGKKLTPYAAEDFNRLSRVIFNSHRSHRSAWERISGSQELSPAQLAVLDQLCQWRERTSEKLDRPPFKVLGDDKLLALAQASPTDRPSLAVVGLTERQLERFGSSLLQAIRDGLQAEPIQPRNNHRRRPPESVLRRLDRIRAWRKQTAAGMGVDSDIVLPRAHMVAIAEQGPQTLDALKTLMDDLPWRYRHFGEEILRLLKA